MLLMIIGFLIDSIRLFKNPDRSDQMLLKALIENALTEIQTYIYYHLRL